MHKACILPPETWQIKFVFIHHRERPSGTRTKLKTFLNRNNTYRKGRNHSMRRVQKNLLNISVHWHCSSHPLLRTSLNLPSTWHCVATAWTGSIRRHILSFQNCPEWIEKGNQNFSFLFRNLNVVPNLMSPLKVTMFLVLIVCLQSVGYFSMYEPSASCC